jgi:hypothetical protein
VTRVWYCANCGYEVHSRGRCHACRSKLTASALPELETGPDDDEVGYRLEGWDDTDRGRLIVRLNDMGLEHRFEEDELIVHAADEARVDDLVAMLGESAGGAGADTGGSTGRPGGEADEEDDGYDGYDRELDDLDGAETGDSPEDGPDDDFGASVRLLADAATRLRMDPTDMHADADVAEASAGVFIIDSYGPFDEEEWSAIGRVTRRLLAALGAEEALEADIRREAGVLEKLLAPLRPKAAAAEGDGASGGVSPGEAGERTVYELADWYPDQRAQLGVLLEDADIAYEWEGDELLVPSAREDEVERLFEQVGGSGGDGDDDDADERRYQAVAELFAASGRLAGDPTDEARRDAVLEWIEATEGPPLLGMQDVDWFRIRSRARVLASAIEDGQGPGEVHDHANQLHDMLRSVV